MNQSLLNNPVRLQRLGYIFVWTEAVLGGILFAGCWTPLTHGIFAALLGAVLLCTRVAHKSRAARVTVRIINSLFWPLAALLAVQTFFVAMYNFSEIYFARLQEGVAWFGGLFLCYLAPASATAMLRFGAHTAGYDRLLGCLYLPAQLVVAYVALFTDADIPWTLDGTVLPYIWLALTALTTLLLWRCACVRTPEQESVITRRREARQEKSAARRRLK